jgi:hypothetical protein
MRVWRRLKTSIHRSCTAIRGMIKARGSWHEENARLPCVATRQPLTAQGFIPGNQASKIIRVLKGRNRVRFVSPRQGELFSWKHDPRTKVPGYQRLSLRDTKYPYTAFLALYFFSTPSSSFLSFLSSAAFSTALV